MHELVLDPNTQTSLAGMDVTQWPAPVDLIDHIEFVSGSEECAIAPVENEPGLLTSNEQAHTIQQAPGTHPPARLRNAPPFIAFDSSSTPFRRDRLAEFEARRQRCDVSLAREHAPTYTSAQAASYNRFRNELIAILRDEPIEDGVTHPAEAVIAGVLCKNTSACKNWLSRALEEHKVTHPSLAASIVRCVGRLEYVQVDAWGMGVADDALRHGSVEVREAAVRALEAWGGRKALEMLRNHHDKRPWLDDYVQDVIADLSRTTP